MKARAMIMSPHGAVHRILTQGDGSDGTGCGQKILQGRNSPVRPVQALVYHLNECQLPGCWALGQWKRFLEGSLK